MDNSYKYRTASVNDAKQLSVLFQSVYIETYGRHGISQEFANFITEQFSLESILSRTQSSAHQLIVATLDKNLIGVLQIDYEKSCPIGNLVAAEINKLYILKRFYGQGIGQDLMLIAEQQLIKKNEQIVWLWVWDQNSRAIEFYKKQGYEKIGNADFHMEENSYGNEVLKKELC